MKHVWWVVGLGVVLSAFGCSAKPESEPIAATTAPLTVSGLVAAYSFDEGTGSVLGDISGNGNDGAISGATWSEGVHGSALSFDGQDDWVTIPDADSLDLTTGMTLEAWVRPTMRHGWESALLKEGDTDLAYASYANDGDNEAGSWLGVPSDPDIGPASDPAAEGYGLPLNTWSHVVTTYDGSFFDLYINGDLRASVPLPGLVIPATTGPLRLGGDGLWGEFFEGSIDEVRVYNRALSQEEVLADMDEPVVDFAPDSIAPTISITSPSTDATLTGAVTITTAAADDQALERRSV